MFSGTVLRKKSATFPIPEKWNQEKIKDGFRMLTHPDSKSKFDGRTKDGREVLGNRLTVHGGKQL